MQAAAGSRRCAAACCGAAAAAAPPLALAPRPLAPAAAPRRAAPPGRRAALGVACKQRAAPAAVSRRGGGAAGGRPRRGNSASTKKGFAKPDARVLAEPWEAELPPYYRAYYKAGFRPPRFLGPIDLRKNEDGTVDVAAQDQIVTSQLLAVVPALAYLEAGFGEHPSIEELHAALLAADAAPPAGVGRVLHLLPRAAPDAADGPAAALASSPPAVEEMGVAGAAVVAGAAAPPPRSPLAGAEDILDLDPKSWAARAAGRALPSTAPPAELPAPDDLLAALQASAYGEEYLDPASAQLRREVPRGFLGVWPELAAMRHSCAPNTAVAVVGGGHAFVHAAKDIAAGDALTTNKIGGSILGPLDVRQAAVRALTGRGCGCARCALEASLPEGLRAQLAELAGRMEAEWAAALDAAAAAGDETALAALWEDVTLDVDALLEALAGEGLEPDAIDEVAAGAYAAAELAWTLEELTQAEPRLSRLAAAVRMLRCAAPGSESHAAAALQLHGIAAARVSELLKAERGRRGGRTAAGEKRLLAKVVGSNADAEGALVAFYEAMCIRYGFQSEEGLLPQLQSALELFYTGLDQLGAAATAGGGSGGGGGAAPRELLVDGIPVTVVDRVSGPGGGSGRPGGGGGGGGGGAAPDFELSSAGTGVVRGGVRLRVVQAERGGGGGEPGSGGGVFAGAAAGAAAGEGSLHEDGPLIVGEGPAGGDGPEDYLAP
ncbi:MAG: hypothetical protein J3K34DRAFT_521745 [Monoraphidium minutum]|nr:MAG: hypothetical protein J3K34DRAFT_521745 [Monoraphidium minutum]